MFDGIKSLAKLASKSREQMNDMQQLIELLTTRNDYLTRDNHELRAQVARLNQLLSGHER
jgi:cell division protein FtsB